MSETVKTQNISVETQIHITGIVISCPIDGEYSATVNFKKANVTEGGSVVGYEPMTSEEGPSQLNLNQSEIVELLGVDVLENLKTSLHDKRKQNAEV